jgi:serine/threonine protein kinase
MAEDEQFRRLVDRWEELHEQGMAPDVEQWCTEYPHLADDLRAWVAALHSMQWLDRPNTDESEKRETTDARSTVATNNEGKRLGRYHLERILGEGGFGEVWSAYDPHLDRHVAIKLPRRDRNTLQDMDAFLVEARKVASLRHAGIVPVFDVGQAEGQWFFVCQLIEGTDLSQRIGDSPLPPAEIARIVRDIALALHYAHEQGFVHRDLKPANILLDRHGKAYLTDFGIALTQSEWNASRAQTVGTLAYMAPEQIEGIAESFDARADVYALGVVLYQTLTRQLPFPEHSPLELRRAVLSDVPRSPRTIDSQIPAELERICLKAMAKSPANRYRHAKSLADDLDRFLAPRSRWAIRIVLGVMVVSLVLGIIVWRWWHNAQEMARTVPAITSAKAEKTIQETLARIRESSTTTLEFPAHPPQHSADEEHHEPIAAASQTDQTRDQGSRAIEPVAISRFASVVDLTGRELTDAHFRQLAGCLLLRRLNLANTPTTNELLGQLRIPGVEDLNLSHTQVSDAGLKCLSRSPALTHLSLANDAITDEGLKELGTLRLRSLDLSGTKITDAGLPHLGDSYGVAGYLHNLNLRDTAITDQCLESLKKLSHLKQLDLRETQVTTSGIHELQKALPDCAIDR